MVQNLEAVAFLPQNYYDAVHYFTNGKKLLKCQGGLKWMTLTKRRPVARVRIRMRPKTKRMVPFSFFGILVYVPKGGNQHQLVSVADTSNVTHVYAKLSTRYNEWHQDFNFRRV